MNCVLTKGFMNDLLFALRQLRKSPGFTFVITVRMSGLSV